MPPHNRWRSKNVLLPLALTFAATAATVGLWLWLENDEEAEAARHYPLGNGSSDESDGRGNGAGGVLGGGKLGLGDRKKKKLSRVDEESGGEYGSGHGGMGGGSGSGRVTNLQGQTMDGGSGPGGIMSPGGRSDGSSISRTYVPPAKKRTVALVVSAESTNSTLLTSLPHPLPIPSNTLLHILIYTPQLTNSNTTPSTGTPAPPSKIHDMAYALLPTHYPKEYILPYTTHPTGTSSLLRHLTPEIVYIEEGLVDSTGKLMKELLEKGWIREGVVVLGTGVNAQKNTSTAIDLAGLVDSDDERMGIEKIEMGEAMAMPGGGGEYKGKEKEKGGVQLRQKWYEEQGWDGARGGGSVLERLHLAEDWGRRVVDRG